MCRRRRRCMWINRKHEKVEICFRILFNIIIHMSRHSTHVLFSTDRSPIVNN